MSDDGETGSTNGTDDEDGENGHSSENGENGNGQTPVDEEDGHGPDGENGDGCVDEANGYSPDGEPGFEDVAAVAPVSATRGETPGILGALVAMLLTIGVALSSIAALIFSTDPPNLQALGVKPAAAAAATAPCSNGPGALAPSGVILACVGFQNTQLPNVFPEVPPAVATPTPAPVVTPTPESTSTSTSSSFSQSTHTVTPPPPPANCIPNTMSADGSTVSGTGNTRSSERVYTWPSGSFAGSTTFSISGLNLGSTCSPHYSLVARETSPFSASNYGYSCGPSTSLSVPGTVAASTTWTMWVDMEPGGCPSGPPH